MATTFHVVNLMCGAVVTVILVIIVFMFTQRYFIEGIVASGIGLRRQDMYQLNENHP